MKKFAALVFLFLFGAVAAFAQENTVTTTDPNAPVITFKETKHDFGDIKQGDVVTYVFEFENTGKSPLILSQVQTTCGCTTPKWPREPIAPGTKSSITAQFNSTGKMGHQNKVITVISNASNSPARVSIVSNVLPKDDSATGSK
ncbi:Protein of unknown function [Catalinimonas alkaloidigena]|uniref:Uncharacterized protein n=1 Tax=Catalinimonas alkaloidigena TaxID=1075417 RepID=A0A1G9SG71_9BACT|nr:DUF1573 domain-containing protein [Catalinimonas alkaloidigena]SDM34401.1 Protein of unknown function [Catalinimonas alkaloidigena]